MKTKYYLTYNLTSIFWKGFFRTKITDDEGKIKYFKTKKEAEKYGEIDKFGTGWLNYYMRVKEKKDSK